MKRRTLVLAMGAALAGPRALGQAAKEPRRVALLSVATEASFASSLQAVRDGLRERGHVEGRDIVVDIRYADGRAQELPRLAAELAALKPTVIIALGTLATDAALAVAADAPIVSLGDLVAAGHAAQLGRPGGRVTGISFLPSPLNAKRLELLAELLPKGSAVLNLGDPNSPIGMQSVEAAGHSLGLVLHAAYASTPAEIDTAFARARKLRVVGINVLNSPFLSAEHARGQRQTARHLPVAGDSPRRRTDGLWAEPHRDVPATRRLRLAHPERREARRPADRAADDIRVGHQPESGEGAGLADSAIAIAARG